ncbi:MAG: class I SAM-dependent RNA methyltransferase [Beijerinckiaceae bacterium]
MTGIFTIDHLGHRGDGVAHQDGADMFIPYTLPGERVRINQADVRPVPLEIITPSPDRAAPFCKHFTRCGGCALQHASRHFELHWKRALVIDALAQRGLNTDVLPCVDAHGEGRRRVTLHVRQTATGIEAGFMAARSHALVAIDHCPLLVPALQDAPQLAADIGFILAARRKPMDVQITATREGLDIDVRGVGEINQPLRQKLADYANAKNLARLALHGELLAARRPPLVAMGDALVEIPAGSFLQATAQAESVISDMITAALGKSKSVADLFSGCGPFALRIARQARVHAVEFDKGSIAALEKAVRNTQGLKPVTGEVRDLYRRPLLVNELDQYEAVVFDPPRNGAEALARNLALTKKVKTIIGVSCNAATFARDARIVCDGGWALQRVMPVDQFRHAAHVELVAVFSR